MTEGDDILLVTGSAGQIGSELTTVLRDRYGSDSVIASDVVDVSDDLDGPFETLDVTDRSKLETVVETYDVDRIYHLAAILSAAGEQNPQLAYDVNVNGLYNVLEVAREADLDQVFVPSSIAVYGPTTPDHPGEETILMPTTMYGISKVIAELFGEYYYQTYGLDVRGLRLPGIISHKTKPGGGTTDYAVEVFYDAIERGHYTYFVEEDTMLPMIYMPDAINAICKLTEADGSNLRHRCTYNVPSLAFTPSDLTREIRTRLPSFDADYEPDGRQQIADSWPSTVDDTAAREDWEIELEYGLESMVEDMLEHLSNRLQPPAANANHR